MGWRLILKGPDTTSFEGISLGFTVVLPFLKRESAQKLKATPKAISGMPR